VRPARRNSGPGKRLVALAEQHARVQGVKVICLLTMTAERFFACLGDAPLLRGRAPAAIEATTEFSSLCPASSVFMAKRLVS